MKNLHRTSLGAVFFALMGALVLFTALPSTAKAQEVGNSKKLGIGLAFGSPSGITGKYYLNQKNALQATLGLGFVDGNHMNFSLDYLFHLNLLQKSDFRLDGYVGIGGYLWFWLDDTDDNNGNDKEGMALGVEVPLGLAFVFAKIPLDIYVQVAPGFSVIGRTGFGWSGAFGVRYYF